MQFPVLGPLEVVNGGAPLEIRGAKQRALLAALLLHANESVSRDRLIERHWAISRLEAQDTVSTSTCRGSAEPCTRMAETSC